MQTNKKKYFPNLGIDALLSYYEGLGNINPNENGIYYDVLTNSELQELLENCTFKGTLSNRLGSWLKYVVENNIEDLSPNSPYYAPKLINLLNEGSYDSICKKFISLANESDLQLSYHRQWLIKLCDKNSEYFCSDFYNDLVKIYPQVKIILKDTDPKSNETKRKQWLVCYLKESKLHPYRTLSMDVKAKKIADKKYKMPGLDNPTAFRMFVDCCDPDSTKFDKDIFEHAFNVIKCNVDKENPTTSIKELLTRILRNGVAIGDPRDKTTASNFYYWFEKYTDSSSKYYDADYTDTLKKDFSNLIPNFNNNESLVNELVEDFINQYISKKIYLGGVSEFYKSFLSDPKYKDFVEDFRPGLGIHAFKGLVNSKHIWLTADSKKKLADFEIEKTTKLDEVNADIQTMYEEQVSSQLEYYPTYAKFDNIYKKYPNGVNAKLPIDNIRAKYENNTLHYDNIKRKVYKHLIHIAGSCVGLDDWASKCIDDFPSLGISIHGVGLFTIKDNFFTCNNNRGRGKWIEVLSKKEQAEFLKIYTDVSSRGRSVAAKNRPPGWNRRYEKKLSIATKKIQRITIG